MNYQIFKCFDKKMTKTTEPKGGSQKNVPKGGSQKIEPKGGSQKIEPKGGSQKIEPKGESQKIEPKGGSQKIEPKGESQKNVPKGGSQKNVPKGGSQKNVPKGGANITPLGKKIIKDYKADTIYNPLTKKHVKTGGSGRLPIPGVTQEQWNALNQPPTDIEKKLVNDLQNEIDTAIAQRNTFEWWQGVYYYLLFKYKFNKPDDKNGNYSGFLIYEKIENTNADKDLPQTRPYTKDNITQYNGLGENYHKFHLKYNEVLYEKKMRSEIRKPENEELLKYLFHAGENWSRDPRENEFNPRPTDPDVNQSDIITNMGIEYKVNKKKEDPKYIIEDKNVNKLIKHCQKQFGAGRDTIRKPSLGDFFFGKIKLDESNNSLLSVFIHYTINNFKQQMNLCKNQSCEDTFRTSLQIFYIAPGISSLYLTPKFEFTNYPGVLYHYIEVFKEYDFEERGLNRTNPPEMKATLEIKRHYNDGPGKNMSDDLFVTKIDKSYYHDDGSSKYDEVNVNSYYFNNLQLETNSITNILEMKTKYQDYYSALKDGWFGNNNSNDFYNIRKSMFNFFKLW
jgi:hypothetical protein